jgi:DNA-binding MarR family transcriptional regulator
MIIYSASFNAMPRNCPEPHFGEKKLINKGNKQQLSIQVLKKFRVIYGSVRQHFREVEQDCGVTGAQLWIMQEVSTSSGIGISELAERLSIHQSTCSQLVEKLVAQNMIIKKRCKEDQRRVGLQINQATAQPKLMGSCPAEGVLLDALAALSPDVTQALEMELEKVIEQLQIMDSKLAEKPLSHL